MALLVIILISGCSTKAAAPSEFLGHSGEDIGQIDRYPVHRAWISDSFKRAKLKGEYTKVIVMPVNTDYLREMDWWEIQAARKKSQIAGDAHELGEFFEHRLKEEIAGNSELQLVDEPQEGTYVLEVAIIELEPSKGWWNAAAMAGGFVVPGMGLLSEFGKGSIAIEGRVRDANTGELLGVFADRKEDKGAPVNLASFAWYQASKNNIDDWVTSYVATSNTQLDEKVSRPLPFTLKPW